PFVQAVELAERLLLRLALAREGLEGVRLADLGLLEAVGLLKAVGRLEAGAISQLEAGSPLAAAVVGRAVAAEAAEPAFLRIGRLDADRQDEGQSECGNQWMTKSCHDVPPSVNWQAVSPALHCPAGSAGGCYAWAACFRQKQQTPPGRRDRGHRGYP